MNKASKIPQRGEMQSIPRRGEIWIIKCDKFKEFSKDQRPFLIISNDIQNQFDELVAVVPLTTENVENVKSFEVFIKNTPKNGLDKPSKIVLNHPFTFSKELRLKKCLGVVGSEIMNKTKKAWELAFDWEI